MKFLFSQTFLLQQFPLSNFQEIQEKGKQIIRGGTDLAQTMEQCWLSIVWTFQYLIMESNKWVRTRFPGRTGSLQTISSGNQRLLWSSGKSNLQEQIIIGCDCKHFQQCKTSFISEDKIWGGIRSWCCLVRTNQNKYYGVLQHNED